MRKSGLKFRAAPEIEDQCLAGGHGEIDPRMEYGWVAAAKDEGGNAQKASYPVAGDDAQTISRFKFRNECIGLSRIENIDFRFSFRSGDPLKVVMSIASGSSRGVEDLDFKFVEFPLGIFEDRMVLAGSYPRPSLQEIFVDVGDGAEVTVLLRTILKIHQERGIEDQEIIVLMTGKKPGNPFRIQGRIVPRSP